MGSKSLLTWHEVDYLGNLALLREAERSGVRKFGYVSVFNADHLLEVPMVRAHEEFSEELSRSGIESVIIRPTGYFSDLGAFVKMAQAGKVWMIGSGNTRMNPIHGADLAEYCVRATADYSGVTSVGGPQTLTQREIAEAAFRAVGVPPRVTEIPLSLARAALAVYGVFNPRRRDLAKFFVESAALDFVAPACGTRLLAEHFRRLPAGESRNQVNPKVGSKMAHGDGKITRCNDRGRSSQVPRTSISRGEQAARPDAPFVSASVTKMHTAAVCLKMVNEERLDLDAEMAACLPARLTVGLPTSLTKRGRTGIRGSRTRSHSSSGKSVGISPAVGLRAAR